uniref:Cleavage stimulation factor 50 kDa subunit n=1 Tax=Calcidiscus leptoporus TaxID=127549 RepID=A0A7S0JAY0_9EUKA|mmetsp:Transcript_47810/g.110790  ORF Transcript_47810/g.110790 Transcript_47810/m.110790 type:complete len:382 (+) Transcript_47810:229-1374(+)
MELNRLMVEQLLVDGHPAAAHAVATATLTPISSAHGGSPRLAAMVRSAEDALDRSVRLSLEAVQTAEYDAEPFAELWALPHAGGVARFSADGAVCAIGGDNGAVRLFERDSMLAGRRGAVHAKLSYSDHKERVNDLDFHPHKPVLVTAAQDSTMRFFDYSQAAAGVSRAVQQCMDTYPVNSVAFHPAGDHLLAGTQHAVVHLYDVNTFRCFLSSQPTQHHSAPIADARWAHDGSLFASCAADTIKIWDGLSSQCARTISTAHRGAAVNAICFGGGSKYLLSCGGDSTVRLWDVGSGRQVMQYDGARQTSRRTNVCFSHDEALVISSDEDVGELVFWEARTAKIFDRCSGHGLPVRWIAHSPVESAIVSCGEDAIARFWVPG